MWCGFRIEDRVCAVDFCWVVLWWFFLCFFFQAEDGIRDLVRSRWLGDVYKRQEWWSTGNRVTERSGYLLLFEEGRDPEWTMRVLSYSLRDRQTFEIVRERGFERGFVGRQRSEFCFYPPDEFSWNAYCLFWTHVVFTPRKGLQEAVLDRRFAVQSSRSPDGKSIAFMGHTEELRISAIHGNWGEIDGSSWLRFTVGTLCISDLNMANVREFPELRITGLACHGGTGAWSPDGEQVLFCAFRDPQWYRKESLENILLKDKADFSRKLPQFVYTCHVKDGATKALCEGQAGRWSPDGKRVAVLRDGYHLFVADSEGKSTPLHLLSERWRIPDFCWSPDGKRSATSVVLNELGKTWPRC